MISVIIPTLNAEKYIEKQLEIIEKQSAFATQDYEVIVIDSESEDRTVEIARHYGANVINVKRREFDHGGTRNIAWRASKGEIICFLTQDALPADEYYIENLIKGFDDLSVMMISGRQIPRDSANPVEKLTRNFNYPAISFTRTSADIEQLGIKAYFFSDACSAYRRTILEGMNGFEEPILTNEDMLMAARVINKGYAIGYAGDAGVYHSHNFSLKYHYSRNFDVAAFLAMYRDEINSGSTTGEGMKMVKFTILGLLKQFRIISVFRCVFESGAKFLGNRAGKNYMNMAQSKILKKTTNPNYWINNKF